MMYYAYIIRSLFNGKYYIGCTSNLEQRLFEHNHNKTKSLRNRGPFKIIYFEIYKSKTEARKRESQLKSYKGGNAFKKLVGLYSAPRRSGVPPKAGNPVSRSC